MNLGYERYRKKPFFTIINFNQYKSKLSIVIHNRHKMWREEVAFDNKFITKKSLKTSLKTLVIQIVHNSPPKRQYILADTDSPWKDTFKPPSWNAIWDWIRVWKDLLWIFHLVDFFLSLVLIIK